MIFDAAPRNAKVKAATIRVWLPNATTGGRQLKRPPPAVAPTEANSTKKPKKGTGDAPTKIAAARRYRPAVIDDNSEEELSDAAADELDYDDQAEREAEALESDDERLVGLAPEKLAEALANENPAFEQDSDFEADTLYDKGPAKYRRKSSLKSTHSSRGSDADGRLSDNEQEEVPVTKGARCTAAAVGSRRPDKGKVTDAANPRNSRVPDARDLFETDDHVRDKPASTKRGGWNIDPELYSSSRFKNGDGGLAKSKRDIAHSQEAPSWADDGPVEVSAQRTKGVPRPRRVERPPPGEIDLTQCEAPSTSFVIVSDDEGDGEIHPYDMTALVYNNRGTLNLTAQTIELREVARRAIEQMRVQIYLFDAYPEVGTRRQVALDACIEACRILGPYYNPILRRLKDEGQALYSSAVASIVDGRISSLRRDVKEIAASHCVGHYGLTLGCGEYAVNLLDAQRYVFAGDHRNGQASFLPRNAWRHEAVLAVLRQAFFTGKANFVRKHLDHNQFTTSIAQHPEKEVPIAMVALVCTAIHASIDEWTTGSHTPGDFSGNEWAATYTVHVEMLEWFRDRHPLHYHENMSYLFSTARSSTTVGATARVNERPNALSLMDFSKVAA